MLVARHAAVANGVGLALEALARASSAGGCVEVIAVGAGIAGREIGAAGGTGGISAGSAAEACGALRVGQGKQRKQKDKDGRPHAIEMRR